MRILHTADWHIGKRLHQTNLIQDHQLFFDWLLETIQREHVDVLLVSGDVFDLANPSSEARQLYYNVLVQLLKLNCKVIVIGGNHDSPQVLNAPKEILKALDIHVIGGKPEQVKDMIIPLYNSNNELVSLVAAVPYLRDSDLRKLTHGQQYEDKIQEVKTGISAVYQEVANYCKEEFPKIPVIAMGHLFAHGVSVSDSERAIQVGNLAGIEANQFGDYFKYVALGHIHKPQEVGQTGCVFYSGSPIALSFSERKDEKRLLLLDLEQEFELISIPVPVPRKLIGLKGNLDQIQDKLSSLPKSDQALDNLIELEMVEEHFDPEKLVQLEQLTFQFKCEGYKIVKHRATFKQVVSGTGALFKAEEQLEDLNPLDVFERRMQQENLPVALQMLLKEAFLEVLEEVRR